MTRKISPLSLYLKVRNSNISITKKSLFKRFRLPDHSIKIENYSLIDNSLILHAIGAYSYTHSTLSQTSTVGRYCSIARNVTIMENNHPLDRYTTSPITYASKFKHLFNQKHIQDKEKRVEVGNDVWIGENVTLKREIKIGDGSVIGYGSIVTKDVEPYSIVAGAPAKVIKYRYDEKTIARLIELQWWRYDLAKYNLSPTISIEEFIEQIEKIEHSQDSFASITL